MQTRERVAQAQSPRVPFHVPFLDEAEIHAATAAVREHALGGGGRYSQDVQQRLKELTGAPHAFFVTSCTHAMELALMAFGIGPGDEVILPSFTFTSTATCIVRAGATPVFADIDPRTWNLDPQDVARCLGPRTRAILPVHYAGHPAPVRALASLIAPPCVIIEDAAHAFGAAAHGQPAGTLGDAGCFSFHITKNLTCGEGGALLLNDPEAAQRAEFMRDKGTNRAQFLKGEVAHYAWVAPGSSFVASDLLAAILLEQFNKLPQIASRRQAVWRRYAEALAPLAQAERLTLPVVDPDIQSSYHIFAILVAPERRAAVREALRARGVEAQPHYVPLHSSPYWSRVTGGHQRPLPVTDRVSRSLLRLPIYPALSAAQQDLVIDTLQAFLGA